MIIIGIIIISIKKFKISINIKQIFITLTLFFIIFGVSIFFESYFFRNFEILLLNNLNILNLEYLEAFGLIFFLILFSISIILFKIVRKEDIESLEMFFKGRGIVNKISSRCLHLVKKFIRN